MSIIRKVPTIGVMGPGSQATAAEIENAEKIGALIARQGYRLLTGGSNVGVMHAALKGAKHANPNCPTLGILSHDGDPDKTSQYADFVIPTGMGEGRNYLNIRSSDYIVICCDDISSSFGTSSELMFAMKFKKPLFIVCSEMKFVGKYSTWLMQFTEDQISPHHYVGITLQKVMDSIDELVRE